MLSKSAGSEPDVPTIGSTSLMLAGRVGRAGIRQGL